MYRREFFGIRQDYLLASDVLDWNLILRLIHRDIFHIAQSFIYSLEQGGF